MTRRRGWSDITFTDQFCGAGGSSIGALRVGLRGAIAMNHWDRAVETYATNNPSIPVDHADVSGSDPRRYPSTDILITSPECTTHSPAGGNRRKKKRDLFNLDPVDDPALVRSRATMWDVWRFAEYHEYKAIIVENVVEAVWNWELFPIWLAAGHRLGYKHRIVSLNSMFCHPTPQSRDRVYIVWWKKGNLAPDLEFRPKAPCAKCREIVEAVQVWKGNRRVGKHRFQYIYSCPRCGERVTPFYYAALNAIDFSLAAERIGDRSRPLKPRTIERIQYGLQKYGRRQLIVRTNMTSGVECRVRGLDEPHFAQTASWLDALVSPAFLVNPQHSDGGPHARPLDGPAPTAAASNRPSLCSLVSPSLLIHMHADGTGERVRDARSDVLATQTARQDFGLAMPFLFNVAGRDSSAPVDAPVPTQETREKFALLSPFVVMERTHNKGNGLDEPLPTACAGTVHHALIQGAAQISLRDADAMRVAGLERELMTQGCAPQQAVISHAPFIVSHYGTHNASPIDAPVPSVTTIDRHELVKPDAELRVDDCYFRMLQPHEIGAAMAFPGDYKVLGNKRDRVKQYGNAVTPPAMAELILRVVASLAPEVRK